MQKGKRITKYKKDESVRSTKSNNDLKQLLPLSSLEHTHLYLIWHKLNLLYEYMKY